MDPDIEASARNLLSIGRFYEAAEMLADALAKTPASPVLLYLYSIAVTQTRGDQAGVVAIDQALALGPDNVVFLNQRAELLDRLGKHRKAQATFQRSLELDPDFVETLVRYVESVVWEFGAQLQQSLWKRRRARDLAERAVELAPEDWATHSALAQALLLFRDKSLAVRSARDAVRLAPNNPRALEILGICQQMAGEVTKASDSYVRAGRAAPASSGGAVRRLRDLAIGRPVLGLGVSIGLMVGLRTAAVQAGYAVTVFVAVLLVVAYVLVWSARAWRNHGKMTDESKKLLAIRRGLKHD